MIVVPLQASYGCIFVLNFTVCSSRNVFNTIKVLLKLIPRLA